MTARGVLITRPEPAAHETAERVTALGWRPVLAPMLSITLRKIEPLPGVQAVLVTSANAIPALDGLDRATRLFTVGDATAARATQLGFTDVTSAGRDAAALSALVIAQLAVDGGPLLLASGEGQGLELQRGLRDAGFQIIRRVAYEAVAVPHLPAPAIEALTQGEIGCALFFSAETARAFAAALPVEPACLSVIDAVVLAQPVADAISHLPWRSLRVASHPNQESLVALIAMTEPTTPPPPAAPAALPPPSPPPTPGRTPAATPLWASAAGFVVLALLIVWLAGRGGDVARMAVIEAELHAAQTRLAALEQRPVPDLASVATRLATLEAGVQTSDTGALDRRVTLLEQRPMPPRIDVPAAVEPLLTPITVRLAALEKKPAPDIAGPVTAATAPLAARIETLEKKPAPDIAGPVSAASAALGARIDALDAKFTKALAEAAARVTTAARLRAVFQALEEGRPLGALPGAPPALAKFAAAAPPTESHLRLRFPEAAAAAEQASKPTGEGLDFTQRMLARAQTLVTVRQGDHVLIGAPAAVTLAAARVRLDAGDLAGAVAALAKLDGPAASAMADWLADAQALLDARAALTELAKS